MGLAHADMFEMFFNGLNLSNHTKNLDYKPRF